MGLAWPCCTSTLLHPSSLLICWGAGALRMGCRELGVGAGKQKRPRKHICLRLPCKEMQPLGLRPPENGRGCSAFPTPHQEGTLVSYYCLSFKFLTGGPSSSSLQSSCSGSSLPFPHTPSSPHPLLLSSLAQLTLGRKSEVLGPVLPAGVPVLGLLLRLMSKMDSSVCP